MNATELVLRFVVGGGLIVLVTLLAKTKYPMLSGIFMLFPAVTLVGYYFIGQSMTAPQLQNITRFSIYALSTTFIFLLTFYFTQERFSLNLSLMSSTVAWFISAGVLLILIR
ncbi:MAG: GlpM family protein [Methanosarcinaceae archaeon]